MCCVEMPAFIQRVSIPAPMAATASCICRTSFAVKIMGFFVAVLQIGRPSVGKVSARVPFSCRRPHRISSDNMLMAPLPHMPIGSLFCIVFNFGIIRFHSKSAMAPEMAGQPQESPPPSKAGPAAVLAVYSIPWCRSASSPFVPRSASRHVSSRRSKSRHRSPAVMSPPIKAESQGRMTISVSL